MGLARLRQATLAGERPRRPLTQRFEGSVANPTEHVKDMRGDSNKRDAETTANERHFGAAQRADGFDIDLLVGGFDGFGFDGLANGGFHDSIL